MTADDAQAVLFDVPELEDGADAAGPVEAGLRAALAAGADRSRGHLATEDLGLVGSALAGARALDSALRAVRRDAKAGYLVAALLTPYRETLAALRLPAAVAAVEEPPAGGGSGTADWSSVFGTAE